jgi:cobalt-zinc-cadmium efflux system protein
MAHSYEHTTQKGHGKAFAIGIGLNITFVAVEIYYGLIANSSALLADAGHNASDVLSLVFFCLVSNLACLTGLYGGQFRQDAQFLSEQPH